MSSSDGNFDDLRRRWEAESRACKALGILDTASGTVPRGVARTAEQQAAYERFRASEADYLTALEQFLYDQQ